MRFKAFSFGSICIDGATYEYDVVIDRDRIRKRRKKPSKRFRDKFGPRLRRTGRSNRLLRIDNNIVDNLVYGGFLSIENDRHPFPERRIAEPRFSSRPR